MKTRFKHIWERPVTLAEVGVSFVDIGEIKTLFDLRYRNAEAEYRNHIDNYEDEEVLDSDGFFDVGSNKMRCHYWTATSSGRSKKNAFTVVFKRNSGEVVSSN